jgi:hypothetical protein
VIKAEYWDPGTDAAVTAWISGEGELSGLLDVMIRGGHGHPALELTRPGGSSLMVATGGTRCALVCINRLEESSHSTGGLGGPSPKPSAAPATSYSTARWTRNPSFSSLIEAFCAVPGQITGGVTVA